MNGSDPLTGYPYLSIYFERGWDQNGNRTVDEWLRQGTTEYMSTRYTILEDMVTEQVADLMREKGWTVIPPEEEK